MPMKKYLRAFALCALSPRLATAQEAKTPVVLEKVTYSRAIPKGLRAFVPRGGKSRFWGATNLQYNGQKVWVHFYDISRAKWIKPKEKKPYCLQKSGLDLFTISKSRRLNRISSTHFEYQRWDIDDRGVIYEGRRPQSIGVDTLWLDPKTKKLPIIKITLSGASGLMFEEERILIILDRRLRNGIVQQGFVSGASGDGATIYELAVSFGGVDERGFALITESRIDEGSTKFTTYKWDGKKFAIGSETYEAREQREQ